MASAATLFRLQAEFDNSPESIQTITALLERQSMARVPLIILSIRDREEDVIRGLEAGADDYIVKPFNARELVVRVRKQLCRPKLDG